MCWFGLLKRTLTGPQDEAVRLRRLGRVSRRLVTLHPVLPTSAITLSLRCIRFSKLSLVLFRIASMESAVPLWMPGKKPYGSLDGLIERPEVIIGERQTHLRVRITDYRQKQGNRGCSELSVRARLKEHAEKKQQKVTKEVRHGSRPGKKKSANRISYNTQREHP